MWRRSGIDDLSRNTAELRPPATLSIGLQLTTTALLSELSHTQFTPQQGSRKQYRIELRANQDYQRDEIHPHQQRNRHAQRTVDHAVVGIMLQVKAKNH